jgi:hypothetical protein
MTGRSTAVFGRSRWPLRSSLRSGDLYLPENRRHVSFWNLLTKKRQWTEQLESAYAALALPSEADRVLEWRAREFDDVTSRTESGLGVNPFSTVREGHLQPKRPDAQEIPDRVKEMRRAIETIYLGSGSRTCSQRWTPGADSPGRSAPWADTILVWTTSMWPFRRR